MISMSTTRSLFEVNALIYISHSGAKNVINACRECKVKQLIYNSSADVVFDGLHDICNGDESLPYAGKFIIGSDENMSDFTYVENVAHALICAEAALGSQLVSVSGKEGVTLSIESFSHLSRDSSFARQVNSDEYSKVEKLLGGGKGRTYTHYKILSVELSNDSILTPYNGSARGWKLH
ncbi:3-beta hydroxysteroid dehydrogenase/isomerase family protein [Actinidia rufa]|uniref:3-beta hydroxysteroid dehydrogenase/isomerase family protein n=1 Tax=Actinidia rufa TaxID=165716 RepID=A0A7J0F249_9ERIC|nr:3-beta hydroxysteroid dehydrogenase/isomerase family protein [Actinidia rufa]